MKIRNGWKWYGFALHFIAGNHCRFHLGTRVGHYIISTVGAYYPTGGGEMKEIGFERTYETMVFRSKRDDKDGNPVILSWSEIDSKGYTDSRDAERGHYAMCEKYAEGGGA